MSSTDKSSRSYSVPMRGSIWGVNYNEYSERNLEHQTVVFATIGTNGNDFKDYFNTYLIVGGTEYWRYPTSQLQCPLRILKPHYGELSECFLDLQITVAASDSDLTLKLAVGHFVAGEYIRTTSYTQSEIDASWRKIRGSDVPLSVVGGKISVDLLNLLPIIPKYGDADYRQDAFVLVLAFNKPPTQTGTYKFNYLNIHQSSSGVL